jgi:hypothetical protein
MKVMHPAKRCVYLKYCYLAEAANCFGYKIDCPLYMVSNNEDVAENRFHKAMDQLINKTKLNHEDLPKSGKIDSI